MEDIIRQFRNELLAELIRKNNASLTAAPAITSTISPVDQYRRVEMPNQYYDTRKDGMLFGGGMLGYELNNDNGMLSGRFGADKARINWQNGTNDVDLRFNSQGEANVNWTGKF